MRNCSSEACVLHWRTGPWTQCTATCGRHGFQSRHVTCADPKTGRNSRDHQCTWRPRPTSWQRCNLTPCGRGEGQNRTATFQGCLYLFVFTVGFQFGFCFCSRICKGDTRYAIFKGVSDFFLLSFFLLPLELTFLHTLSNLT